MQKHTLKRILGFTALLLTALSLNLLVWTQAFFSAGRVGSARAGYFGGSGLDHHDPADAGGT
jgi:hypothetical protein